MSKRENFPDKLPPNHTKYCFHCGSPSIEKINKHQDGGLQTFFTCNTCHTTSDRIRIWDPNMIQYFDEKNNLIHEGAGVIVQNEVGDILFFLRTKYPFLWTIPGGHMTPGENSETAALRELEEEVGIKLPTAHLIFEGTIAGDECMGGADIHKWHLYHATVKDTNIKLDEEGSTFAWFPIADIPKNITFPVQYLLAQTEVQKVLTII